MEVVKNAAAKVGIAAACAVLDVPRSSYYRSESPMHGPWPKRSSPRALSASERQGVLDVLHEERFVDKSPAEVQATLLDDGEYLCSTRTMYRVLAAKDEVRERRNQLRHPAYARPELLATKPNELWSWDITKLKGPVKWSYLHLYVILDVFSRCVVGWMVADCESKALAKKLISQTCEREGIEPGQLTLHADRGSSMKSKPVALLLADLGVTKTHSRPHVSDDNPYSESQFKTLKYRPNFPERFGSLQDARAFLGDFFRWYNDEHKHSGIAMLTPRDVHDGRVDERLQRRQTVLSAAFEAHPERFVHGPPAPARPPEKVWINPPKIDGASDPESSSPSASPSPPGEANGGDADGGVSERGVSPLPLSPRPNPPGVQGRSPAGEAPTEHDAIQLAHEAVAPSARNPACAEAAAREMRH